MSSKKKKERHVQVPRDPISREYGSVVRSMERVQSRVASVHRVFSTFGTVSTNASGYVALVQVDSTSVTGTTDWSLANRYTEYRIKSIRVRWFPIVTETQSATTTYLVIPPPGPIVAAVYANSAGYGSAALRGNGAEVQFFPATRIVDKTVDSKGYPDAQLWTPTNSTVAADSRFGMELSDFGYGPTSAVSTPYYRSFVQYLVELRLPQ